MALPLLISFALLAPASAPSSTTADLVPAAFDDDGADVDANAEPAADAEQETIEEEESEPFPWDTVSGVVMGLGGFLAGAGGTAAGVGALMLTAPGTLAAYNVFAFALLGVGAAAGLVGTGAAGGGGALYWFTLPDDEDDE